MPIVESRADGDFAMALPPGATAVQKAFAERTDQARRKLWYGRDIPGYRPLLDRLKEIAQQAFDGIGGAAADLGTASSQLDDLTAELTRLEARPGGFVVDLPDGRDIEFQALPGKTPVPEQLDFKGAVEETLTILKVIFPAGAEAGTMLRGPTSARRFEEYRVKLYWIARVGLEGDADPKTATQALGNLRAEILAQEGPRIKNGYMRLLGAWAAGFAILFAVLYLVIRNNPDFSNLFSAFKNLFPLLTGTMIGTWLSFGIRKNILTLRDLSNLEADMVEPAIRLIFTGLIAVTIAFIFSQGMVNVVVGGLNSANLITQGSTAFLIGILLGVSEQALPGAVTQRAAQFVNEVGGRA